MIEGSQERPHRDDAAAARTFFGIKVLGEGNQAEGKLIQRAGSMNSLSCSGIQMVYAEGVGWKMGGLEDEGREAGGGRMVGHPHAPGSGIWTFTWRKLGTNEG